MGTKDLRRMTFDIKGKTVIITGGSGTLGRSMGGHLSEQGAQLVILGRSQEKVRDAVGSLTASGKEAIGFSGNVLDKGFLLDVRKAVLEKFGKIDALVNAAGGNLPGAVIGEKESIFDLDMKDFRKVSELNLDGSVLPSIVFGEIMARQGQGSIINISSMTSTQAVTRVVGYSASKAAIENFTRWMAVEMAGKFSSKIRVNAIAPGFFIADQNRSLLLNEDQSLTKRGEAIVRKTPMGRFGDPEELSGAVQWLISDASSFVTGAIIPIDGGFSAFSGV